MGKKITNDMKPVIFVEGKYTKQSIKDFNIQNRVWKTVNIYEQQLKELFGIYHPKIKYSPNFETKQMEFIHEHLGKDPSVKGNWIYFPWNGTFIHTVNEEDYFNLRTNRNKNLITADEQKRLYEFPVAIVGLSVGGSIATNLAFQGISKQIKLAEFDTLETTNLNRVKAGIHQIGLPKLQVAIQQIYEINPYSQITSFEKGLNDDNLNDFINGEPKPKVIFEIIDDFPMKIKLHLAARSAGIPVIMMANLGDSVLVDIERFDLDQSTPLFNGAIGNLPEEILKNPSADVNKYAIQIVGLENVPQRALESVKEIGETLIGRPQLSNTVNIAGGFASYLTRSISLGKQIKSGRTRIGFDNLFNSIDNQE